MIPQRPRLSLAAALLAALVPLSALSTAGCKPKAVRGGAGTDNPNLDEGAMSTTLDRKDLQDLLRMNLDKLFASPWWATMKTAPAQPVVAIWPIKNETTEHIDDQLSTLLADIETELVNSGVVAVVSRERQAEMAREVGVQQNTQVYDINLAAQISRQVGAQFFITGKVGVVDEYMGDERRVQYSLFLQVLEVETSLVKFQAKSERSKAIVR
ncbi:MAG: penicillin-binding protein activator LpoB [Myxococcales bacterium]|nr:penicillin-binding protein activator LpoB [Myxococcales bacterium]MCB9707032.1 penicillin-binding protein activator LpoB [Myxococcales bacterium]